MFLFFPFTVWKVLVLSIWCCSLGPNGRWRDTACTVHSTGRDRETKRRGIMHKTRWVGELCPLLCDRHKSSRPVQWASKTEHLGQSVSAQSDGFTSILGIWHDAVYTACVFDYISNKLLFRKCFRSCCFFLAYIGLFHGICLSTAFYMLHHKNAFVLWSSRYTWNAELSWVPSISVSLDE